MAQAWARVRDHRLLFFFFCRRLLCSKAFLIPGPKKGNAGRRVQMVEERPPCLVAKQGFFSFPLSTVDVLAHLFIKLNSAHMPT